MLEYLGQQTSWWIALNPKKIEQDSTAKNKREIDEVFSGFGAPALMSPKEAAIRLLRENYSESFAFTKGTDKRIHLFIIRIGLWALVYTFTPKDFNRNDLTMPDALRLVEDSLSGKDDSFKETLDNSVRNAQSRLKQKTENFRAKTTR